jgi:hypothetical protein
VQKWIDSPGRVWMRRSNKESNMILANKLFRAAAMIAGMAMAATAIAGNIVLVRMGGGLIYPNSSAWASLYGSNNCDNLGTWTEAGKIAFTNVDDTFVVALTNAGHSVSAFWLANNNVSDTDLRRLNTNDLVILDYSINSGPMNQNNGANTGTLCNSTNTGHKWNTLVTAPLVLTKANLARSGSSRMGWFSNMSSNDWSSAPLFSQPTPSDFDSANNLSTTASGKLTFVDESNPLFAGLTYTNDPGGNRVMSNYFTVDISQDLSHPQLVNYFLPSIPYPGPGGLVWPYSSGTLYRRGNSPATLKVVIGGADQGYVNDLSPGRRVLATIDFNPMKDPASDPSAGDNPPQGTAPVPDPDWVVTGVAIAEWPEGSKAYRGCTDPDTGEFTWCDTFGGYRMFIAAGTRDPNTGKQDPDTGGKASGFNAGGWNLTRDGEKVFMRAIDRAILKGKVPGLAAARKGAGTTVKWNPAVRTWKLQQSSNLTSWSDVSTGADNSLDVPGAANTAVFYRLAVK